jgi:hypothetical protein
MSREVLSDLCSLHELTLADKKVATMRKAIQEAGIGRFPPCDLDLPGDHPELGNVLQGDGFNVGDLKFWQVHTHLTNDGRDALQVGHRFTVALADCAESRGTYKQLRLWETITKTQGKAWRHPLSGVVYRLRYYLSGDWVFLKTILGINNPNLDYFCLWCYCSKSEIANPDLTWPIERTGERPRMAAQVARPDLRALNQPGAALPDDRYEGIANDLLLANYRGRAYRSGRPQTVPGTRNVRALLQQWDKVAWRDRAARPAVIDALQKLYAAEKHSAPHHKGQRHRSLVPSIARRDVVIDILHLFLRITDVLLTNLIEDACRFGKECLNRLQAEVRKCGMRNWEYRVGGQGLPNHKVSWDSIDGAVKLTLVENINIREIFDRQVPDRVHFNLDGRVELWAKWSKLYLHLREWQISISAQAFRSLCDTFLECFLGLQHVPQEATRSKLYTRTFPSGEQKNLYYERDVSPYLHSLAKHVADLWDIHGQRLMQFSTYAGEKQNHIRASQFYKSTNHGGGKGTNPAVVQMFGAQLRCTFNPTVQVKPAFQCAVQSCARGYNHHGQLKRHHNYCHKDHPMPRAEM